MKDKLAIVTTWGMVSSNSWCWIDLNNRDNTWQVHCPFNSKEEAIERAKEFMEHFEYSYKLIVEED